LPRPQSLTQVVRRLLWLKVAVFAVLGDRELAIVSPGILGPECFREIAAVIEASTGSPPDHAAIGEVMRRHGLTPAP
jgi:hypothetical protein